MKEILIVSNYYPPEKGAAANRIEQLGLKLSQYGYKVNVVCPLANYPKGIVFPEYRGRFRVTEVLSGIKVSRLWIYPSNSKNIFIRIISILSFSTVLFFFLMFKKTPDKVIVQSPPLLLSFISVFVLALKGKKIILNVSDLWPLAAIELKAMKAGSIPHKISCFMERSIYRNADLVLGQSNEIISHIHEIYPQKKCFLYRNFPEHLHEESFGNNVSGPVKLFYAGLLGVAQGVLEVCEKMDLQNLNIEFHIFGDGSEKKLIIEYLNKHPEKNIHFHGMVDRSELHNRLKDFHVALIPLHTRIYGSVPSKIFEYTAMGIPVLYYGGGEGEDIVREYELGWVADVGNFGELNRQLQSISDLGSANISKMQPSVFRMAKTNFNLDKQMRTLLEQDVF